MAWLPGDTLGISVSTALLDLGPGPAVERDNNVAYGSQELRLAPGNRKQPAPQGGQPSFIDAGALILKLI